MNDYCRGVIEALSWALKAGDKGKIKNLRDKILEGSAADFERRVLMSA